MTYLHYNKLYIPIALTVIAVLCISARPSAAEEAWFAPPLPMGNRTPFTLIHMAPTAPDYTLVTGTHHWSSHLDLSSHSLIDSSGDAIVELDGETTRLALGWQYRPSSRWIVRAELPFITHGGGFLDSIIDRFHSVTGLPDGQRPRQPQDRLLFGYDNNGQRIVFDGRRQRAGDASVSIAYRVFTGNNLAHSNNWQQNSWIQLGVKLPTGSIESLSGSDATDVAFSFHHTRQQVGFSRPLAVSLDAYVIHTGGTQLIRSPERLQYQLQMKLAKQWTATLIPEVQLRYRSSAYQNSLDALGKRSLGIDAGLTLMRQNSYWKIGISEDLIVDSAPDVGLFLQYTRRRR